MEGCSAAVRPPSAASSATIHLSSAPTSRARWSVRAPDGLVLATVLPGSELPRLLLFAPPIRAFAALTLALSLFAINLSRAAFVSPGRCPPPTAAAQQTRAPWLVSVPSTVPVHQHQCEKRALTSSPIATLGESVPSGSFAGTRFGLGASRRSGVSGAAYGLSSSLGGWSSLSSESVSDFYYYRVVVCARLAGWRPSRPCVRRAWYPVGDIFAPMSALRSVLTVLRVGVE